MRRSWWLVLLAAVTSLALVSTAFATHLPANHNISTLVARGTLAETVKFNVDDIKIQTKGPTDVVVLDVTFPELSSAGWHNHPGPVFVTIRSGTISVWNEACVKHTYSAGETFFEPGTTGSLLVKNESSTTPVAITGVFLVPPGTVSLRTGTEHLCGIEE